jgi:type IV pilus assembly protein PilN
MIRINLAPGTERAAKPKAGPALPAGALQSYLLLALFAGGALVLCAGAWWMQSNRLKDLDTRIAADEKRQRDLQAIKVQVDQKSPVHMLDEISKSLPDFVWLTGMDESRGGLRFSGQSNSLAAVADFISALQRSGWFPQVDLATSQEQQSIVNFTLTATFKDPEVAAKEKAAAEAAAAAAAAAGPAAKAKAAR